MKPSWRRVLRLLARGMCLYEIAAPRDRAMLDWDTDESFGLRAHPDNTYVSAACFAYLRQQAFIRPAEAIPIGEVVDRKWRITEAGRAAL